MKRLVAVLIAALALFAAACGKSNGGEKTVATVTVEETIVVITVEETSGEPTLLSVMKELKKAEKLDFTADATGMIMSINGKANPADWSACWMLYLSDEELANAAYGTLEYGGETYGSAVLGANSLLVEAGETYIWSYQIFK